LKGKALNKKYFYKDTNITIDVYKRMSQLIDLYAQEYDISFEDAYALFVNSDTYDLLTDTSNLLWAEVPEFIVREHPLKA
jgi:hypothetical protein